MWNYKQQKKVKYHFSQTILSTINSMEKILNKLQHGKTHSFNFVYIIIRLKGYTIPNSYQMDFIYALFVVWEYTTHSIT